jgi:hypothetical protein
MGAIKKAAERLKVSETTVRNMRRNNVETPEQYKEVRKARKLKERDAAKRKSSNNRAKRGAKSAKKTTTKK